MKPILSSDIIDYLTATLNDYMSPESVAGRIVDFIKALYGMYLMQNGGDESREKFEEFFQTLRIIIIFLTPSPFFRAVHHVFLSKSGPMNFYPS